jgi:hypothetical protein
VREKIGLIHITLIISIILSPEVVQISCCNYIVDDYCAFKRHEKVTVDGDKVTVEFKLGVELDVEK